MFCSKCGSPNLDDAKFCNSCGFNIGSPSNAKSFRSDNAFGKVCKWGIALWTLFCAYGVLAGMNQVAQDNHGNISSAAAVGLTIGLGIWVFVWLLPTAGGAILYFIFGRK